MRRQTIIVGVLASLVTLASQAWSEDKVPAENPGTPSAPTAAPALSLIDSVKDAPDGVLLVKTNDDGGFKSLVVKATVEIDTVLGAAKGKRAAQKEAQMQCKKYLTQWLNEQVVFVENNAKVVTIETKGDESIDAAGNKVKIRNTKGTETKVSIETSASIAAACLTGLVALYSEVTPGKDSEYTMVLGLSQKNIESAAKVRDSLKNSLEGGGNTGGGNKNPGGNGGDDSPKGEKKVNPEADEFVK